MRKMRIVSRRWRRTDLPCAAALAALAVVGLSASGEWLGNAAASLRSAADAGFGAALREAGLRITEVSVEGRRHTREADFARALRGAMGAPSLLVDVDSLRAAVEELDWVSAARVRVRLPGRLEVRVRERRPAAVWWGRTGPAVVDPAGGVIRGAHAGGFADLLHVAGPGARPVVPELALMLARAPDLAPRVRLASWVSERRWTLRTDNGISIHLPETAAAAALARLSSLAGELDLLDRDVDVIDLRLAGRMAVVLRGGGGLASRAGPGA